MRGEIGATQYSPSTFAGPSTLAGSLAGYYSAGGVPTPDGSGVGENCQDGIDYVNGLHTARTCQVPQTDGTTQTSGDIWSFDLTGRMTKHVNSSLLSGTIVGPPPNYRTTTINKQTITTTTNTYNAENRLLSAQTVRSASTNGNPPVNTGLGTTIGWGPNDHPATMQITGSQTTTMTLHWDRDIVLFATDQLGNILDFNAGLDAEAVPGDATFAGLTSYDRDPSGTIIALNNSTGTSGIQPQDPTLQNALWTTTPPGFKSAGIRYIAYVRSDGFQLGASQRLSPVAPVQINGVRAYDSSLGAWTTPDAYQGDAHDPASQQRYMFNRGNAYDYSDPSGYAPDESQIDRAIQAELAGGVEMGMYRGQVERAMPQNQRIDATIKARIDGAKASANAPKGGTYSLRTTSGTVVRNGRTSNQNNRATQHARSYGGLEYHIESLTDDYATQRGLEQKQIETQPGILDKINSISPTNPNNAKYMKAADNFMQRR